jgi:hypothetical protein
MLSLAFALTVVGRAPAARAEEGSGFAFEWRAPEGCPSASVVAEGIAHLLGGPARDLRVQATVERGSHWLVTLETTSKTASGHRTIEAATCQGLANATTLIVALLIDPDAVAAHTGKSQDSEPQPPPPRGLTRQ